MESALRDLEQAFNIELPLVYRHFLLNYPSLLKTTPAADFELLLDPSRIREINRLLDESHVENWEPSFFSIGETGCGDYFAIDLDEEDGEVYFWNHETAEIDDGEGASSIEEFAGRLLAMYAQTSR